MRTVSARGGVTLPVIGFGTYTLNGMQGVAALCQAIESGYRLIDSAFNYENEGAVGAAVRSCGVPREDLIITSKLPGRRQRYEQAVVTIEESLLRTGLDYLDLYLIHWPNPQVGLYVEAWQAMIDARQRGLLKAIGVCNFLPEHLERLERETGVAAAVNQIELHPYYPQTDALAYHAEHGIITESWSPLGRGNDLLANRVIVQIAASRDVTPAQVVLAWHVTLGAIPLPKSSSGERQRENLDSINLTLSTGEVDRILGLARPDGRIADQDPAVYQEF